MIEKLKQYKLLLFLCLIFCGLYYFLIVNRTYVEVTLQTEHQSLFKIYWAQAGQLYSEKRMSYVRVTPERKEYGFYLTDLKNIERLRIDPPQYQGNSTFGKITFRQKGYKSIHFETQEELSQLNPINQIEEYYIDTSGLHVLSNGNDPQFEIHISPAADNFFWPSEIPRFLLICIVVSLVYFAADHLKEKQRIVPFFLVAALYLVTVMAGITENNVHPDEYVHISAAQYYQHHWLPPPVDDPAISHTYSVYGASRLNSHEAYYFFAGKFLNCLAPLHLQDFISIRLFNVALLSLILFATILVAGTRPLALPLLISPQLWYIFSYCDSDAFALFIAFVVSWQVVLERSQLNTCLQQEKDGKMMYRVIFLGILFGLLFLLKKNFYPYILFVYIFLGWRLWELNDAQSRKTAFVRLLVISLIGASLFGLRKGADYYVNGMDRKEKLAVLEEKLADPLYNPLTELSKTHGNLYKKEKGYPLQYIIVHDRWFEKTFRSAFGMYGYFTVSGTEMYYDLVRWTCILLLIIFFGLIILRAGPAEQVIALIVLTLSGLLIGASLWHSWVADFQAQGRYLFPIVSMLGILCSTVRKTVVENILFTLFLTFMFLLSAYSFIWVALLNLPKIIFT